MLPIQNNLKLLFEQPLSPCLHVHLVEYSKYIHQLSVHCRVALTMQAACLLPREIISASKQLLSLDSPHLQISLHCLPILSLILLLFPSPDLLINKPPLIISSFHRLQPSTSLSHSHPTSWLKRRSLLFVPTESRTFTSLLHQKTLIKPNHFISQRAMLLRGRSKDRNRKITPPGPVSFSNEEFGQWTCDGPLFLHLSSSF
jgi:hypothetical protein